MAIKSLQMSILKIVLNLSKETIVQQLNITDQGNVFGNIFVNASALFLIGQVEEKFCSS
jgi:hypothetical protein